MSTLPGGNGWIKGDEEDISEIHNCYCPNCKNSNALTVMLPTNVPMFRQIYIMSLHCEDCNFKNSEVNFGGEIQEKGERITLKVACAEDLNRQLIKSDSCTLLLPKVNLEIPPATQRGVVSTIEGVLMRVVENLEALQSERLRLGDVDNFHRCRTVIQNLKSMACHWDELDDDDDMNREFEPFIVILDDPAGNSFIENPLAPAADPHMTQERFTRTATQDMSLGLQPSKEAMEAGTIDDANPLHKNAANVPVVGLKAIALDQKKRKMFSADTHNSGENIGKDEVLKFPSPCPSCHFGAETDMCVVDIPHFKEVIIMSLLCEKCGYKSNEIKGGGAIPQFGTKVILTASRPEDLAREVLKSDTAGIEIPELELELNEGGLDGVYTTVEGLLEKMHDRLSKANPFQSGDAAKKHHLNNDGGVFSAPSASYVRYIDFLDKLKRMKEGKILPFTLIVSDPFSNSFVGPIPEDAVTLALQADKEGSHKCYEYYVDSAMNIEEYERTDYQNEILGLNDMKTENYQVDDDDLGEIDETDLQEERKNEKKYYGTDQPEELPDRLRRLDIRGPDHPHAVGKGPVENDDTVMGPGSLNFAIPSLAQRGKVTQVKSALLYGLLPEAESCIFSIIDNFERDDQNFIMSDMFEETKKGMVFKLGKQGLGYYTDVPLTELVNKE